MILTRVNLAKQVSSPVRKVVYFTIECPNAAKRVADKLVTSPKDRLIIPFIEPKGLLTAELLARQVQSLTFCDHNDERREPFQKYISDNFPTRKILIYPEDIFRISSKYWADSAQTRCAEIVSASLVDYKEDARNHHCDTKLKFLVPLLRSRNEVMFFKIIFYQYILRIGLCADVFLHYYFLVSDREHAHLSATPSANFNDYRASTILYNTFFNIKTLDSFNLKEAFRIPLRELQKTAQSNSSAYEKVHLVSIEPNIQFLESMDSKSLFEYRFFINQLMTRRTGSVLAFLSRWFDNYSEIVFGLDIDTKTRAGDLNKDQYFQLFMFLKNRQGYRESTFLEAVQHWKHETDI